MAYRLLYSRTCRRQIRSLHPQIKPIVKKQIEKLRDNPYLGKALEKELSGYFSLRSRRFRVIYNIEHQKEIVQIHYVGPRRDVYEIFKDLLAKNRKTNVS